MAIKNATDLLVYKKTSPEQKQITRIKIKSSTPFKDFTSGQNIIINNITDGSGDITDGLQDYLSANTGLATLNSIKDQLVGLSGLAGFDYTQSGLIGTDGSFRYLDVINGANGPVPTLEVLSETAEFKAGAVEIVVIESGQSLVYQPIAYSTSASISMNTDLRDITTKDSQGWQENVAGVRSFEMSTDALWDVNNAVGVESAVNDLVSGDSVDIKFSDRVRNLVATEEVYGEGWLTPSQVTVTKHLEDPFGQFTAAKLEVAAAGASRYHQYDQPIGPVEGKKVTWTFYLKKSGTSGSLNLLVYTTRGDGSAFYNPVSIEIESGSGSIGTAIGAVKTITGLSTTGFTRVKVTTDSVISGTDFNGMKFRIYPGADYQNQTTADKVITASWQIETGTDASDYQNPTEVDCYQGKAFVNSVSIDAGTEENATYSASFTGTSELFVNGLGHELVGDNYFDGTVDSTSSYEYINPWWQLSKPTNTTSTFSNGEARLIWTSGATTFLKSYSQDTNAALNIMVVGQKYELTYTLTTASSGSKIIIEEAGPDKNIPCVVGTHTVRFTADSQNFKVKSDSTSGDVRFSYISLKQVFS